MAATAMESWLRNQRGVSIIHHSATSYLLILRTGHKSKERTHDTTCHRLWFVMASFMDYTPLEMRYVFFSPFFPLFSIFFSCMSLHLSSPVRIFHYWRANPVQKYCSSETSQTTLYVSLRSLSTVTEYLCETFNVSQHDSATFLVDSGPTN